MRVTTAAKEVFEFVADAIDGFGMDSSKAGQLFTGIGWTQNDKLDIGVVFTAYTGFDVCLSCRARKGKAFTRKILRAVADLVFNQWGCSRVTAIVSEKNLGGQYLARRLGFVEEGIKRGGYDGLHDAIMFGMLKDECKWL